MPEARIERFGFTFAKRSLPDSSLEIAAAEADDCFRVERTLNEAGIPFN